MFVNWLVYISWPISLANSVWMLARCNLASYVSVHGLMSSSTFSGDVVAIRMFKYSLPLSIGLAPWKNGVRS